MLKRVMVTVLSAMVVLTGCGTGASTGSKESNAPKATQSSTTDGNPTKVLFWHSMSGANQANLEKIVNGFNASQKEVVVVAENQGSYDESTSKFFNMNGGAGRPSLIQIGEQNLQSMIDSQLIEPVSNQVKDYNYKLDDLIPQVVNFYTVNKTLYAMPFNASSPVLYYNVEALKNAGYDKAPSTYEEILKAGPKIKASNNGMRAFTKPVYGYALDQMVTNMGGLVVNNANGRTSRTTEVAYQNEILTIFTWLHDLIKADQFVNYGKNIDNIVTGFYKKDIAMFISTSATAAKLVTSAPFEVGIAYLPHSEGKEPQGVYAGGGALVVSKGLPAKEREATMKFMQYATSAEVQAVWAGDTGYFPINTKSFETNTMQAIYAKTTQLKVAADQFKNSKQTEATAGPLLSQLPQLRNDLQAAEEMVFNGKNPREAMDQAVANTNKQIKKANESIKK
jgi:sn-glycerol 3-phosphate transport system substrate-binding protein